MRVLMLLIVSCFLLQLKSQIKVKKIDNLATKWTQEIAEKSTYNDQTTSAYSLANGDIITVRTDDDFKHAEIARFDSSFRHKCSGSVEKEFKVEKEKFNVLSSMLVNDKPHLIGVFTDKEENVSVGAFEIKQNCSIDPKGIILDPFAAQDEKVKMKFAAYDGATFMSSKKPSIYFIRSKNNQFGLIASRVGNITQENQKVILVVVDKRFKEIFKSEIVLPVKYANFSFVSLIVSNDGTPYALVNNTKSLSKLDIKSYLLRGSNGKIESNEINIGEGNIRNTKIVNDIDDKVKLISAVVKEKKQAAPLTKLIISEVNSQTGAISNKSTIEINDDFIKKYGLNPKEDLENIVIRNFDQTADGGSFLTLEHFESVMETLTYGNVYTFKQGNITTTWDQTSSKDLENKRYFNAIVLRLNPQNNLMWAKLVEKEQLFASSSMVNYGGFQTIVHDNNSLGLVFNDHIDNYQKDNKKITSVHSLINAALVYRKVSENEIEGQVLFEGKKEKCNMKPMSFSKIDNKIVMCGNAIVAMGKTTKISKYGLLEIKGGMINKDNANSSASQAVNSSSTSSSSSNNPTSNSSPGNTSAIAHGEAKTPSASVAKNYKFKADERSVEYYNDLRKKFDEEEKIRKEKEALQAIENAKKEEEVKQGRRLPEEQAPQFDKYRQGAKNAEVKKTSAEEDYKTLFK